MYDKIINEVPQLKRGIVWCTECGKSQKVNSKYCFKNSWPTCCGYTMTLDSPEERKNYEQHMDTNSRWS